MRPAANTVASPSRVTSDGRIAASRSDILALQQHLGNRAVARLLRRDKDHQATISRTPVQRSLLQREDAKPVTTAQKTGAVKDRAEAEAVLKQRWKVGSVIEGSVADQAGRLKTFSMDYFNSPAPPGDVAVMLAAASWKAWSPAAGSSIWPWLVEAFENFDKVLVAYLK